MRNLVFILPVVCCLTSDATRPVAQWAYAVKGYMESRAADEEYGRDTLLRTISQYEEAVLQKHKTRRDIALQLTAEMIMAEGRSR